MDLLEIEEAPPVTKKKMDVLEIEEAPPVV
jgi:hypothetical protein